MYRESSRQTGLCPACKRMLAESSSGRHRYQSCQQCHGSLVDHRTLQEMWAELAPAGKQMEVRRRLGLARHRSCPLCDAQMAFTWVVAVPVDSCELHGIWFDTEELETALAAAALPLEQWIMQFLDKLRDMT